MWYVIVVCSETCREHHGSPVSWWQLSTCWQMSPTSVSSLQQKCYCQKPSLSYVTRSLSDSDTSWARFRVSFALTGSVKYSLWCACRGCRITSKNHDVTELYQRWVSCIYCNCSLFTVWVVDIEKVFTLFQTNSAHLSSSSHVYVVDVCTAHVWLHGVDHASLCCSVYVRRC